MNKVLFMIDSLNGGGAEKVLINILNKLNYEDFSVTLFLTYGEGIYLKSVPPCVKIKHLLLGNNTINKWHPLKKYIYKIHRKILLNLTLFLKGRPIYNLILREKYDFEISFLEGYTCLFVGNSKNKNAQRISWIHTDLERRRTIRKAQELDALNNMDKIICVSNGSKKSVLSLYPQLENKVQVIYNLIDRDEIINKSCDKIAFEKTKITLICVGRLEFPKGYNILIDAHKDLIEEGIDHQIVIIGEGSLRNELEQQIEELGLHDSVILKGYIENPYPYMRLADIFVLPSLFEGLPLVLAEAIILGKPSIATKCVGSLEILDNKYGLLAEPGDKISLKKAMKEMILNKETRNYYANKAIQRADLFNAEQVMEKFNSIVNN